MLYSSDKFSTCAWCRAQFRHLACATASRVAWRCGGDTQNFLVLLVFRLNDRRETVSVFLHVGFLESD